MHFTLRRVELWIHHVEQHFDEVVFFTTEVPTRNDYDDDDMTKTAQFRPTLLSAIPLGQSSFRWQL